MFEDFTIVQNGSFSEKIHKYTQTDYIPTPKYRQINAHDYQVSNAVIQIAPDFEFSECGMASTL